MEWVEVTAKSVEAAVAAALEELGLTEEEASVEVVQEPEKGFLGFGGSEAIVRVSQRPKEKSRGRRRRRGGRGKGGKPAGDAPQQQAQKRDQKRDQKPDQKPKKRDQRTPRQQQRDQKKTPRQQPKQRSRRGGDQESGGKTIETTGNGGERGQERPPARTSEPSVQSTQEADVAEQAEILRSFMSGLVEAFGLEGETATRIEDDIIYVDVTGEQTEALVGSRGSILQAILDLMKIIVQRKTHHRARIRLDIAGYAQRRREALIIYSQRLSEQVRADGEEVMLEPMHPGDRKVVHDAVAEIEGVRSWSEGEEPNRSVIIGLAPGFEPATRDDGE